MTPKEKQTIRASLHTLTELVYGLLRREAGNDEEEIILLKGYEEALLRIINTLEE